jgi:hypothetical protein
MNVRMFLREKLIDLANIEKVSSLFIDTRVNLK